MNKLNQPPKSPILGGLVKLGDTPQTPARVFSGLLIQNILKSLLFRCYYRPAIFSPDGLYQGMRFSAVDNIRKSRRG